MKKTSLLSCTVLTFSILVGFLLVSFSKTSAQTVQTVAERGGESFPAEALGKLPYLYFSDNNMGEADIFRIRAEEGTVEINGQRYIGFQFLSTGLVEWLLITGPDDLESGDWVLINPSGTQVGSVRRIDIPLKDCPRVVARYPQARRVTRYKTEGTGLETRGRYRLLQKTGPGKASPYAISLASCSPGSYEAGRSGKLIKDLSTQPLRPSSDVVIENMKALRHEQGVDASMAYLKREMEQRVDDRENADNFPLAQRDEARGGYTALYISAWYDAQTGGGRIDENWAAAVYGVMYEVCVKRGYFTLTDVAGNLSSSLSSAGRYGKLAEVLEIWNEGMRLGGYQLDTTSYPDLGPALPMLTQVRKRDIPYLAPYGHAKEQGIKVMNAASNLGSNDVNTIECYADHIWYQGHWQQSLEWSAWALRWASDPVSDEPKRGLGYRWHSSMISIANSLSEFGLWEEALALHESALKQKNDGGYEGSYNVSHLMACLRLKRYLGRALPENVIDEARDLIKRAEGNIYQSGATILSYKTSLAGFLIHFGRVSEGEALLDELATKGSQGARIVRLTHWIEIGRTAGVEAELLALLKHYREGGRKMSEIGLYRTYADFLEKQGRLDETLKIRRELVRLCRSFDIFTYLPVEMAKLAALLNKMSLWDESLLVANQVRELLDKTQVPEHLARSARGSLDDIVRGNPVAEKKDPPLRVEFQPFQSIVIPLKGTSWMSHITLTNPSGTNQSGMLRYTGLPVRFHETDGELHDHVDIIATLGAKEGDQELKVRIDPASYKLIALTASKDFTSHGELSLHWTPDKGEGSAVTHIQLEEVIGGATKSIIQAGAYKLNPFYGIPIYHQYIDTNKDKQSRPMRFVCSENARTEIYAMDGSPIAIDGQGNGSLQDAGDELFGGGDGKGNLQLPITEGSASFMIMIYPEREIPKDGLSLQIECLENGKWELYAEDRLMPAVD